MENVCIKFLLSCLQLKVVKGMKKHLHRVARHVVYTGHVLCLFLSGLPKSLAFFNKEICQLELFFCHSI